MGEIPIVLSIFYLLLYVVIKFLIGNFPLLNLKPTYVQFIFKLDIQR